ncbi:uncharacterized protein LOC116138295 [Pistacia vera]|uniref:uncharacterized protein LOC116138295 n=1 Tax=Pistacia vera TaxID=55513 RepID=UPI001263382A|nr:uncharacterized protein LOC116138295 [Pistacia vera]
MVKSKMENRMDNVEKEMNTIKEDISTLKIDMGSVKEYLTEMRELMRMREERDGRRDREREKSSSSVENQNSGGEKEPDRGDSEEVGKEEKKNTCKLELPIFNGEDPYGWFFRADRYFTINRYQETKVVEAAAVCMEGRALSWYQWVESRAPFQSWDAFKTTLIDRFQPSFTGSAYEALVALKQDGTVTEYREQFEANDAPLKDLGEDLLKGIFANGLKEEIKVEIQLTQPTSLFGLMDQPHRVEERNWVLEKYRPKSFKNQMGRGEPYSRVSPNLDASCSNWWNTSAKPPDPLSFSSNSNKGPERREKSTESVGSSNRNFRLLSEAEIQFKRERGCAIAVTKNLG